MTRAEAINIICGEELGKYNFFEARNNIENELVILQDEVNWVVYATDERASKITGSEKTFNNESDALENFIKRLRALNVLIKSAKAN